MRFNKTCVALYESGNSPIVKALSEGFKKFGFHVELRDVNGFKERDAENYFDIVVVHGLRAKFREAAVFHEKTQRIPVLVFDFGYLNRVNGLEDYKDKHWGLGFGDFGWHPDFDVPEDRLNALDIKIDFSKRNPQDEIVIFAQMPNDASHQMNECELNSYYNNLASKLRLNFKDSKITFRHHPRYKKLTCDYVHGYDNCDIKDTLSRARFIVTINSTSGIDALMNGCPVVTTRKCYYSKYVTSLEDVIRGKEPHFCEEKIVRDFFKKLAYAQWKFEECKNGDPVKFFLDNGLINKV